MKIYGIKCKDITMGATIAEAKVENNDFELVYVTIQEYDTLELTVSKQSVYDFLAEDDGVPAEDFMEEYTTWKDAKASWYFWVFDRLKKVMKMMGEC